MRTLAIILAYMAQSHLLRAEDGWHNRWEAAGDTWEEKWHNLLSTVDEFPETQKIEILGDGAKLGARTDVWTPSETHMRFSNEAVSKLTAIPGHAEHFGNKISVPYAAIKQAYAEGKDTGEIGWSGYMRDSMDAFITLSMLPSPETVRVLGDMLSDDWKWPGYEKDKLFGTMDTRALSSLSKLPIANPPTRKLHTDADMREFLDDWKDWHAEIKSGQRSFSFKGQSVEYRFKPDGTWETIPIANPPDDAPEVPESSPADRRPVAQVTKEQPPGNADKTFSPYIFAALAALLALAAAWFGLRRMKSGT
jgi:hypothetical protein